MSDDEGSTNQDRSALMNKYLFGESDNNSHHQQQQQQSQTNDDIRIRSKSQDSSRLLKPGIVRIKNKEIERGVRIRNVNSLVNSQNTRLLNEKQELNDLNNRLDDLVESLKAKKAQNDELQDRLTKVRENILYGEAESKYKKAYQEDLEDAKRELNHVSEMSTISKIRASRSMYDLDKLKEMFDDEMRYQTVTREKIRLLENQRAESLHELSYLKENYESRNKSLLDDADRNQKLRDQLKNLSNNLDSEQERRIDIECKIQTLLERKKFDQELYRIMREELERLFLYKGVGSMQDPKSFFINELRELKEKIRDDFKKLNDYNYETTREEWEYKCVQQIEQIETARRAQEEARAAQEKEEQTNYTALCQERTANNEELKQLKQTEFNLTTRLDELTRKLEGYRSNVNYERDAKERELWTLREQIGGLKNDLSTMLGSTKSIDSEVAVYARLLNQKLTSTITQTTTFEQYENLVFTSEEKNNSAEREQRRLAEQNELKRKQMELEENNRKLREIEETRIRQRELEVQQRRQRELEEQQRRQREIEEQQRRQRELEEQRRLMELEEQQRRQREFEEQQRRQREIEEQQRRLKELEEQRRQRELEEQQRRQRELEEQQRKLREIEEQRRLKEIEEQHRRQRELEEQQRRQRDLEEQQRKLRELEEQQRKIREMEEHQRKVREVDERERRQREFEELQRRQREQEEKQRIQRELEEEINRQVMMEKKRKMEIEERNRCTKIEEHHQVIIQQKKQVTDFDQKQKQFLESQMKQQQQQNQLQIIEEQRCQKELELERQRRLKIEREEHEKYILEKLRQEQELYEIQQRKKLIQNEQHQQQQQQQHRNQVQIYRNECKIEPKPLVDVQCIDNVSLYTKRVVEESRKSTEVYEEHRMGGTKITTAANDNWKLLNNNNINNNLHRNNSNVEKQIDIRLEPIQLENNNNINNNRIKTSQHQQHYHQYQTYVDSGNNKNMVIVNTAPKQQEVTTIVSKAPLPPTANCRQIVKTNTTKNETFSNKYAIKHKANRYVSGAIGILETSLNGEYIILENLSSNKTVNLKGWYIHKYVPDQNINVIFKFTDDVLLASGDKLKILSKCAKQRSSSVHEGLNNKSSFSTGEKIIVAHNVENWGTYSKYSVTKLINQDGVDKAVLTQSLLRLASSSNNVNSLPGLEIDQSSQCANMDIQRRLKTKSSTNLNNTSSGMSNAISINRNSIIEHGNDANALRYTMTSCPPCPPCLPCPVAVTAPVGECISTTTTTQTKTSTTTSHESTVTTTTKQGPCKLITESAGSTRSPLINLNLTRQF